MKNIKNTNKLTKTTIYIYIYNRKTLTKQTNKHTQTKLQK